MQTFVRVPLSINAVSATLLAGQIEHAIESESPVIVLVGEDERFCTGMDLDSFQDVKDPTLVSRSLQAFASCLLLLATAPKPTIALVDKEALGGGLGLAAVCDRCICTDRARLGLPEALFGLTPSIIRPILLHRLTPQRLDAMILTGNSKSASEALAWGLIDQVVEPKELIAACNSAVREFSRVHTRAIGVLRRWSAQRLEAELSQGVSETLQALGDELILGGLRSFILEGIAPWVRR